MRNLLALVGAGTITFVGLGWYLDWYRIERQPAPAGYQRVQLDINPQKITDDVQAGFERGANFIDSIRNKPDAAAPIVVPAPGGAILAPAPAPPPSVPTVVPGQGWRPIGSTPTSNASDNGAGRFNIRPLPPPR
jgi:hypothetical protein